MKPPYDITLSKKTLQTTVFVNKSTFTRKDYLAVFKDISTATANRVKKGIYIGLLEKMREKNRTVYVVKE